MRIPTLTFLLVSGIIVLSAFGDGKGEFHSTSGAPAGYAGDPAGGNKTCNISGCHSGPQQPDQNSWITSNVPVTGYQPGASYTITATATGAGSTKFGFEISPQDGKGTLLGTLANLNSQTKLVGSNKYVTHTMGGTSGSGSKTWQFRWTAPATGSDTVTFYGAFNVTNSNNNATGDLIYKSKLQVAGATTSVYENPADDVMELYPVPAADQLNVILKNNSFLPTFVEIIHINGQPVHRSNWISGSSQLIDLNELQAGLYILKIGGGQTSVMRSFIKL